MAFAGRFSGSEKPLEREPGTDRDSPPLTHGEIGHRADRDLFSSEYVRNGAVALVADVRRDPQAPYAKELVERWGRRGVDRLAALDGDYALARIDDREPSLTLALAPLTELELYYHRGDDGTVSFATHLPDLIERVSPTLDMEAMARAFRFSAFAEDPGTLYRDVYQVQPGTAVTFDARGQTITRWWSLGPAGTFRGSARAAADQLRDLLGRAVTARLDAMVGAKATLLSAGRDSGAVTAVAATLLAAKGERLDAWTAAAFAEGETSANHLLDEAPLAARTAAGFANIDHHVRRPARIDLCERLDAIHRAVGVPILQPIAMAWCEDVWDAADARGNRLLLSGDFGNYALSAGGLAMLEDVRREDGVGGWLASIAAAAWRAPGRLRPLAGATLGRRWRDRGPVDETPVEALLRGPLRAAMRGNSADTDCRSYRHWLRDGIAVANGSNDVVHLGRRLEMTDPTRDRALVEFVHSLPSSLLAGPDDRRRIFDMAFGDLLPREVLRPTARGRQNADWHSSYCPVEMRAGLARYRQSARVREMVDAEALERALGRWPTQRTLSGPLWREMVLGVLPALALASFLFTLDE